MIEEQYLETDFPLATDGDIAVTNLESARQQSWNRFWQAPEQPGTAEHIVERESFTVQFLGDVRALNRLETLVNCLVRVGADPMRTALIAAQVASITHRFVDARNYLAQAALLGVLPPRAHRLSLSIDQACGDRLESVLYVRRQMAEESRRLEDLVPLGALLADLGNFDEADRIYDQALKEYTDVSPFAVAWVCFQRGVLWGELVPETESSRAAVWYRKAIEYLPCYVKARVHLSEIYLHLGRVEDAESLLVSVISSGDPEVSWRLADVMVAMGRLSDAEVRMQAARSGFESVLNKYLLAFADHGAEFYSGSGNDSRRAFALANVNLANRPTLRAFEQAYEAAVGAGETYAASELLTAARKRWGETIGFERPALAAAGSDMN
jgi:tetratricopeptide (TPR) repeat protein